MVVSSDCVPFSAMACHSPASCRRCKTGLVRDGVGIGPWTWVAVTPPRHSGQRAPGSASPTLSCGIAFPIVRVDSRPSGPLARRSALAVVTWFPFGPGVKFPSCLHVMFYLGSCLRCVCNRCVCMPSSRRGGRFHSLQAVLAAHLQLFALVAALLSRHPLRQLLAHAC